MIAVVHTKKEDKSPAENEEKREKETRPVRTQLSIFSSLGPLGFRDDRGGDFSSTRGVITQLERRKSCLAWYETEEIGARPQGG